MRVYHNLTTGEAEIVQDGKPSITLLARSLQQLVDALWKRGFVLGRTSHWADDGDRRRHGLDLAPGADGTAA